MRKLLVAAIALLAAAGPASATSRYVAHLSSAKTGTATGIAIFILSDDETSVDYNASYEGLLGTNTGFHVHRKDGGIIYDLGTGVDPSIGTWDTILPEDVTRLKTAGLFVNVHSDLYPAGEIQGPLLLDTTPVENTTWGEIKALYSK